MYLTGCALPDLKSIQSQVEAIQVYNTKRQNYLVVSIHGHLYNNIEMLHAYRCFANTDTLTRFRIHDTKALKTMSKGSLEMDLFDIGTIYGIAENDQDRLGDWLYLCAYFHKYSSVLFGNMKYQDTSTNRTNSTLISGTTSNSPIDIDSTGSTTLAGHWPNIHTFVKAVAAKRHEIQRLFSDTISYSTVATVLQTTLTNDAIIEAEIKVLMNCEKLYISASDITQFRVVKLLYDYSQPLQKFVQICAQYNFCLVNTGETFRSLQADVVNFYSFPDDRIRNDCVRFFDHLYHIFCRHDSTTTNANESADATETQTVPPYLMVLLKIDELTKVLSWLLPLTYVSYGPKIWQYVVVDMKWCGKDGYSKFMDTYHNVRNTLTEIQGRNENTILENVAPVVQLFSIIGKYKDNCRTIRDLLQEFQTNDCDVLQKCINETSMERYIHEANSRIEAIRELFSCNIHTIEDGLVGRPIKIPMLRRCYDALTTTPRPTQPIVMYGTLADESEMRSWLDAQALPSIVGDLLVSSGIRTMEDVRLWSKLDEPEKHDIISALTKLDRIKLLNAIKNMVAVDSTKKRKSGGGIFSFNK
jgi:hypothetical protein